MEEKIFLLDPSRFLIGPDPIKRPYIRRKVRRQLGRFNGAPILWVANVHKAYLFNGIQAEFNDLLRFRQSSTAAYETMTGKKYEPLPAKKAPAKKQSAMDRLAAARAARGK